VVVHDKNVLPRKTKKKNRNVVVHDTKDNQDRQKGTIAML